MKALARLGVGAAALVVISQSQNWVWVIDSRSKVVRQGGIIDNPSYLKPGTYTSGSAGHQLARLTRLHPGLEGDVRHHLGLCRQQHQGHRGPLTRSSRGTT
ncbi:hypothetical protein GCM10009744_00400 [Kribbella alba]|uniref:Uncharacterized protein n=1 Tax=Kribbella alba TaxID=190197 RepID=A0ABN2EWJ0_9ACTN